MKRTLPCIVAILAASLGLARGDGTIQFRNSALTRVIDIRGTFPFGMVFGVFVVSSNGCGSLIYPLGTSSTTVAGLIDAPNPFFIPGTSEGEIVSLQIIGWPGSFGTNWCEALRTGFTYYGETDVRQVTLGSTNTPAVIWQTASGLNPNRFNPLFIGILSPPSVYLDVNDITVGEGTSGFVNATFTISRRYGWSPWACCTNYPESELFSTTNGTALAGQDYVATNGIVRFAPGESSTTVSVTLMADAPSEPDETFAVVLGGPYYLTYGKRAGTCFITEARVIEARVDGTDVVVTFHTVAGRHYAVEFSIDFATWIVVAGAGDVTGAGGPMTIRDPGAGIGGQRFYRMRLLAP